MPRRVLLTGDPGRAEELANSLLRDVSVLNRNRGLLVISGTYRGEELAIVSHGMGGPSMAIVAEELALLGLKVAVRLGTAASLREDTGVGDVIVAAGASSLKGGAGLGLYFGDVTPPSFPSPALTLRLLEELRGLGLRVRLGPVFSSDSFYAETPELGRQLNQKGFVGIEMECATLTALSWMRGFESACALVVSNIVGSHKASDEERVNRSIALAAKGVLEVLASYRPLGLPGTGSSTTTESL